MPHHREDVVDRALVVLDDYGLADLTMRRLGTELGVQPSALYHHFANKQALLAAVADEMLARGASPLPDASWEERARASCLVLRDACLAWRDGAEVVATARAFGLGGRAPYDELVDVLTGGGIDEELAATVARTLLHYVLGHALDEQLQRQAGSAGALHTGAGDPLANDHTADVTTGIDLVLTGLRARIVPGGPGAGWRISARDVDVRAVQLGEHDRALEVELRVGQSGRGQVDSVE